MTLAKIDHPRRIDQFVDYFGEPRRAAPDSRRPWADAGDPRETRRPEAESVWVMTAHAFYAPV